MSAFLLCNNAVSKAGAYLEPSHGKEVQQVERKLILDEKAMERAIARISYEIIERNKGADELCVVGILSRGAELAGRIAGKISQIENKRVPCGVLDITAFRDDSKKETAGDDQTDLPFPIEGKRVVLVDDVIYTGRSARSAMEAVMKRGRAKAIQLAALVDRGTGNCRFARILSARTCPPPNRKQYRCLSKREMASTVFTSYRNKGRRRNADSGRQGS